MQTRNWLLNCVRGEELKEQIYKTTLKFQEWRDIQTKKPLMAELVRIFSRELHFKTWKTKNSDFSSNNDFTIPVPLILGGFGFSNFSSIAAVASASSFVSSLTCGLCKSTYSMYPTELSTFACINEW